MQTTVRSSLLPSVSASLLALTVLGVPASAQSRDGWSYTTITNSTRVRYRVAGTAYRMDDLPMSGSAAGTAEGVYRIFNRADNTLTTVDPSHHMATVMSFTSLLGPDSSNLAPKLVPHVTKHEFEDLGAGEKILGHATRHVRVTTIGTFEITMMGQTCKGPWDEVKETWVAPDVDLQTDVDPYGSIIGLDSARQLGLADKNMPKGAALRRISRSVEPDSTGKPITSTSTSEVVDLTFGPLDASIFAVPADFQTLDLRSAGMMDSTTKANMATAFRSFCPTGRGGSGLLNEYEPSVRTYPSASPTFVRAMTAAIRRED